jgi:hypothetical protein
LEYRDFFLRVRNISCIFLEVKAFISGVKMVWERVMMSSELGKVYRV